MEEEEEIKQKDACYLIVHGVSKSHNVGTLVRCACAFGVKQLCLVGSNRYRTFGCQGSIDHLSMRHFHTLEEAKENLFKEEGVYICGVEIMEGAMPIQELPFRGPTAFLLGNEGYGLTEKEMSMCDHFVYIPQYGRGTASLNVAVAASIVLHHYALWAGYEEAPRERNKYVVASKPMRTQRRGIVSLSPEETVRLRKEREEERQRESLEDAAPYMELF